MTAVGANEVEFHARLRSTLLRLEEDSLMLFAGRALLRDTRQLSRINVSLSTDTKTCSCRQSNMQAILHRCMTVMIDKWFDRSGRRVSRACAAATALVVGLQAKLLKLRLRALHHIGCA